MEFPPVVTFESYEEVLALKDCRAVVLATPVSTHHGMALRALQAGLVLMVDHTFLYHPAVQRIRRLVEAGEVGQVRFIDSTRINLGLFQNDVNVFWDLAVHDLSIVQYIIGHSPVSVQAAGFSHMETHLESSGHLVLRCANGAFVHINASWESPVKVRHMLIGGAKKMILHNDLDQNEPVKVYDSCVVATSQDARSKLKYDYRIGDVFSPKIPQIEALSNMAGEFVAATHGELVPVSSGSFGVELVASSRRPSPPVPSSPPSSRNSRATSAAGMWSA
jgi:predicted dehydrogenase